MHNRLSLLLLGLLAILGAKSQTTAYLHLKESDYLQALTREMKAHMHKGNNLLTVRDPSGALQEYLIAFELAQQLPDTADENWKLYTSLGRIMEDMRSHRLALIFAKRAYDIVLQIEPKVSQSHYLRMGFIATIFLRMNELDSAEIYFEKSLNIAQKLGDKVFLAGAYNNLGMLYASGNRPEALSAYQHAQQLLAQDSSGEPVGISILDNIAEYQLKAGKWQQALTTCADMRAWLERYSSKRLRPDEARDRSLKIHLKEANARIGLRQWQQALALLAYIPNQTDFGQSIDYQLQKARLLSEVYLQTGEDKKALAAQQQVASILDTLFQRQQLFTTAVAGGLASIQTQTLQRAMENAELKAREQALIASQEARNARQNLWITLLVGLVAALLLAGGYVLSRRRILLKQQQVALEKTRRELAQIQLQKEQIEKAHLSTSLEHRQRDLSDLVMYMSEVREWQSRMLEQLDLAGQADEGEKQTMMRNLRQDLRNLLAVDERQQLIHDNFEVLNREFFARLAALYPSLTQGEIELCGYLRLNLSTKDIATLRNVTPKAIEMGRYRLRKKMGFGSDENISARLQDI